MKLLYLAAFLFCFQTLLHAQSGFQTILIHLKDKGVGAHYKSTADKYLSAKAMERRLRQNIEITMTDVPVNQAYIDKMEAMGAKILSKSRWFNYVVVEASPAVAKNLQNLEFLKGMTYLDNQPKENPITAYKAFFNNEYFSPVAPGNTFKSTATNLYNYGNGYNQITMLKGEFLHNHGFSGEGMTIAVLDAGFNSVDVLPAFDSLRNNNQIKGVKDFVDPAGNIYNTGISSHGTMVLSTMGSYLPGNLIGTAPKADYWLLRSEDATAEYILEEYYWVEAAEYADSIGADIINSSLGYTVFDDPASNHSYEDMDGNTTYITQGADMAASKGILVVNSAGNSGGDPWTYIGAPADGDSVCTAGAVDAFGNYAYFSSKGPTYDGRIKPTLSTQGQNSAVYSPWGIGFGSGTSFSSPILAGMIACFWQAAPSLNNMQIIGALTSTASKSIEPDTLLGWGIPDFEAAMETLGLSGINDNKDIADMQVFPNPFTSSLKVIPSFVLKEEYQIEIFNLQGKRVYERIVNHVPIGNCIAIDDIENLTPGLYLISVKSGQKQTSLRIQKL
jgi:hypothetical protein